MTSRTFVKFVGMLLVGGLTSCADGTGPDGAGRLLGILQLESAGSANSGAEPGGESPLRWSIPPGDLFHYPPEVIDAPRTAVVGVPFDLSVYTVGPNGCWSADGIDVSQAGRVIELTPWDRFSGADACTQIFGYLGHPTTITLDEIGVWTLQARGRRVRGDGSVDDSVTAEQTVVVVEDAAAVEVTLGVGEEALIDAIFRVAFAEVTEDSRCPVDVGCVWQGNAAVVLGLTLGMGPTHPFTVNTGVEPHSAVHGPYRVTLLGLSPAPVSTAAIDPESYTAHLLVEKVL